MFLGSILTPIVSWKAAMMVNTPQSSVFVWRNGAVMVNSGSPLSSLGKMSCPNKLRTLHKMSFLPVELGREHRFRFSCWISRYRPPLMSLCLSYHLSWWPMWSATLTCLRPQLDLFVQDVSNLLAFGNGVKIMSAS